MKKVIAIFDIGKTNKKLFLFDENYKIVYENSTRFIETEDEDGFPCENLASLKVWIEDSLKEIFQLKDFNIKAINFSTYGASFVYLDNQLQSFTPLYNYLKPYPTLLQNQFYEKYGGEEEFSFRTASPVLGSLNSGMQLYRIKYEKPEIFRQIKYALHLPQYLNNLIASGIFSDITSLGCHTNLWDFPSQKYHQWVKEENILQKLGPIVPSDHTINTCLSGENRAVGIGLHDSSAALIPYFKNFNEPFVLISTGTWCISLNPFNHTSLTKEELRNDCLCYMSYEGKPIKASRLFAGQDHEQQIKRIGTYFNLSPAKYQSIHFDPLVRKKLKGTDGNKEYPQNIPGSFKESSFSKRDLSLFNNDEEAYHQLMIDIVEQQYNSTQLVIKGTAVKRIFVDGGFSNNSIYMNLLASKFPAIEVFAASMAQATALGAALCIHKSWNKKELPGDNIELKYFSSRTHQ